MITGTFRRDGYSGFGANNPWGNFGSVGVSWVFSEEKFMSATRDWFDMGKLRLSWGTNGNREFGDVYSTLANRLWQEETWLILCTTRMVIPMWLIRFI